MATAELHQLEVDHRGDITEISNTLADINSQLAVFEKQRTEIASEIGILESSVLPEIHAKQNLTETEIQSLEQELNVTVQQQQQMAALNAQNMEGLAADLDTITQLAQQIAEVVKSTDSVLEASKLFTAISNKHAYNGQTFSETCKSREEISNALAGLLQHVQDTQTHETQRTQQVDSTFEAYADSLRSQLLTLRNSSVVYAARETEAVNKRETLSLQLADISAKGGQLQERRVRLEGFKAWTTNALTSRSTISSETIEKCNIVAQLVTLLQAKLAVRTVSTQ
jgi:hypothetical protein